MPASSRPRRIPTRRQKIIESSSSEEEEEEEEEAQQEEEVVEVEEETQQEEEEEYAPVATTPRRAPRRLTSQTPAGTSRARRPASGENVPPSRATARGRGGRATRRQRISGPASEAAYVPVIFAICVGWLGCSSN